MSSVTWMLFPLKTPAFLRTSSLSLNSWKVARTGRQPSTSGPVITRLAADTVISRLICRFPFSREITCNKHLLLIHFSMRFLLLKRSVTSPMGHWANDRYHTVSQVAHYCTTTPPNQPTMKIFHQFGETIDVQKGDFIVKLLEVCISPC